MRFVLILLLYGGIQIYFAAKAIRAFDAAAWGWVPALAWAGLMTIGPLLQWRLERRPDRHVLAVGSAWVVFGWMGFSFLFIWLGLALDAYGWVARLASLPMPEARPAFGFLVWLTLGVWVAGFFSARHPRVERLTIYSNKIPPGPGLRIAQISDVHLGILIGRQRLDRILQQLTALQPDILVSTGDLVDAEAHHLDGLSERLAAYQPRYGKFAITGNHERFAGLEHALDFMFAPASPCCAGRPLRCPEELRWPGWTTRR
ncbi:MAG: metallophosphoesterase [Thiobacillus sp.]|nr:metallophosphoesterase [Thiobacillus sp.]